MSSQITPIITTNIHRKLLVETAATDSTIKTINPLIIATSIGTGLVVTPIKKRAPVKEWGKNWT